MEFLVPFINFLLIGGITAVTVGSRSMAAPSKDTSADTARRSNLLWKRKKKHKKPKVIDISPSVSINTFSPEDRHWHIVPPRLLPISEP
ncbi:hypothetical protein PCANC_06098 [Puccinia coronata f. sp. avenae]|uniref:Uncharacterized protein n=1 Tax=Puccinia coronata f. sp. avenae TaxID=200324 RepID=A0A2N5VTV3_9BASI|nr:hypothetical protein PCASD_22412 [Puccinia coronata f. sp. avenae]PLW17690.1 hypothetical protein PCANC_10862 [Puccinia coronata f. sp. avenae]PLW38361.1 hypothetical protein PCASD_10577 [Puccinia coronata f. sp. avenae]PLW53430.1 hypothetical protein PCANC_06098 [Puccinia coronata f. sp. avenae]